MMTENQKRYIASLAEEVGLGNDADAGIRHVLGRDPETYVSKRQASTIITRLKAQLGHETGRTTRERRQARMEKRDEWADSRRRKAEGSFERSHEAVKGIVFGQPILVGHHSEARHRRALKRSEDAAFQGIAHQKSEAHHENAAGAIERELKRAIYDDDEDAIQQLENKIAGLEARRSRIKAINAHVRKHKTIEGVELDAAEKKDIAYVNRFHPGDPDKPRAYPAYVSQNLSGNLTRLRQRLKRLKADRQWEEALPEPAPLPGAEVRGRTELPSADRTPSQAAEPSPQTDNPPHQPERPPTQPDEREHGGADFVVQEQQVAATPSIPDQQATLGDAFATNRNLGFNLESQDFGGAPEALTDVRPTPDPRQTSFAADPAREPVPEPTPEPARQGRFAPGTKIYYTGDMANHDGFGEIVEVLPNTNVKVKMDDGRTSILFDQQVGTKYEGGHAGTRFVTREAYDSYRSAQIAEMTADAEALQRRREAAAAKPQVTAAESEPKPKRTARPKTAAATDDKPKPAREGKAKAKADFKPKDSAEYAIHSVPITAVTVRPDLFQARDTDEPGGATGAERVRQIVENWNPDRFDPLAVVEDKETGTYVVIGGHHRLEAVKELGKATVPVRVLTGELNDPLDRDRLIREAIVSNYTMAAPNIREDVTAAKRLADTGLDTRAIAREMRITRPSQIEDLLWIEKAGPVIINQIADHGELIPVAAELGRAMEQYEYSQEAAGGLFSKYRQEFVETGKAPSRYALRLTFQAAEKAKEASQTHQAGMFGGFEDDSSLNALQSLAAEIEAARTANRSLRRNLKACKILSAKLNVPVQDIEAAAERQLSGQDDRFEKLRQGIVTPKPEPVTVVPVPPVAEHSPEVTVRPARVAPDPAVAVVVVAEPAPRAEPPVAVVAVTDSAPRPPKLKAPPKKRTESFRERTIRQAAESALGGRRRKRQRRHPFLNRSEQ